MSIAKGLIAASAATLLLAAPALGQTPGTVPAGRTTQKAPVQRPPYLPAASSGLKTFYRAYGRYELAVSASGRYAARQLYLQVKKPSAEAVVEKAFLMSATYGGAQLDENSVKLEGGNITWMATEYNDLQSIPQFSHNGLADVTDIVKSKLDLAAPGIVKFTANELIPESNDSGIDGEILAVVFSTPDGQRRTVALLFGTQKVDGDMFEIALQSPLRQTPGAIAEMGLGISYSAQGGIFPQFTTVSVNGKQVTRSAGGADDGRPTDGNGALITVGGLRDRSDNPLDPTALPSQNRSDDERYSLRPFMSEGDTSIKVRTVNPTRDDNVFFAWFELATEASVTELADGDDDGDGLLNSWETFGYDSDGDGLVDVDLPAMGADPKRKDLFVAYAWMEKSGSESASHEPSQAVLDAVSAAFDRAPVPNPNGVNGIKLHWKNLGSAPHDDDLNPTWDQFDAIMNGRLSDGERKVYRRMLNAHAYGGGSSSGIARGIPASDFIESLGRFSTNPGTFSQRAGTIMHELGHTLGLRHGGVDHENYKPNHLSVMNYHNQLDWVLKDGAPWLDYERFSLSDLNEAALDETAGMDASVGDAAIAPYGVRWFSNFNRYQKTSGTDANVDWNANGNSTETSVSVDLNNSGSRSTLRAGFVEWDNLVYAAGSVGATADARASFLANPQTDLKELTEEEYLSMKRRTRIRN